MGEGSSDSIGPLLMPTALSFLNGAALCFLFTSSRRLRQSVIVRAASLVYLLGCSVLYAVILAESSPLTPLAYLCVLMAVSGYLPLILYIGHSGFRRSLAPAIAARNRGWAGARLGRWRRRLVYGGRRRKQRLLRSKLEECARKGSNAALRLELMELHWSLGELDEAAFHAYVLDELLPRGHSHCYALYRLSQILAERRKKLEEAQPYLRRLLRLYPRSYFASYARRLVNQCEAYADP
ncbi:MAG: hypothetical protein ACE5GW_07220 [Planctomycetota bacterium]